jgi:alpha-beta hydrolase superfamily lysophospholipase
MNTLKSKDGTTIAFDKQGDSGEAKPYAVEREIEDIDAVIDEAGGSAFVYGHSSGGCLALGRYRQTGRQPEALAPVLVEFFAA